uniref:Uncharacterized protein n=1 Tax=Timema cristinae TaxID=61476 RepID=A0A7R9CDF7_TIMCR|nr:unnamed protein product [Timema cristinae]
MVSGSVRKLEALSPRQRSRGQVARSRRQQQQQQQCELPESYKYLHQRSNAPATITSSYENVMQAQTSSRTSTSYPDLMQRHVDGDGMPHYLKSNYHHMSPTVSGNNSCYHPHQQYQQQPLRRSFGHPGSIQATMRDSYNNHHSTTNHNEMQWTSSYYGNTSTSQVTTKLKTKQKKKSSSGLETGGEEAVIPPPEITCPSALPLQLE